MLDIVSFGQFVKALLLYYDSTGKDKATAYKTIDRVALDNNLDPIYL